jgi:hypothetical protein
MVTWVDGFTTPPDDDPEAEPRYRVNLGDDPELVEGEILLLKRLMEKLDSRLEADATPEQRQAAFIAMGEEDQETQEILERLHEMSRCHSRSIVDGLYALAMEDSEEDDAPANGSDDDDDLFSTGEPWNAG